LLALFGHLQPVLLPWAAPQVDEPRLVSLVLRLALHLDLQRRAAWVEVYWVVQAVCRLSDHREPRQPEPAWQAVLAVRQHEAHEQRVPPAVMFAGAQTLKFYRDLARERQGEM
jgi:hypothetical protein